MQITVPDTYGYVLLAVSSQYLLNTVQGFLVSRKRRLAKVPYPQAYADKAQQDSDPNAFTFNCAQRAHYNTLESAPFVIFSTLLTGVLYPYLAAILGGTFTVTRMVYTLSYINGGPKNRSGPFYIGLIGSELPVVLLGTAIWTSFKMIN